MMSKQGHSARIGVIMLAAALVATVFLFKKDTIDTALMGGRTISATFSEDYKLLPNRSVVKVGFVEVGKVSSVSRNSDGTAKVTLKVDESVLDTLGSSPSATIRTTTLLGGSHFVDLARGGSPGQFRASSIPRSRTHLPVEVDKVAAALQPDAISGAQKGLDRLDASLTASDRSALRRLLANAPDTLAPGGRVLDAAQGEKPDDLTHVVSGLESTGRVLTSNDGQLDSILADLGTTSRVLGDRSASVSAALEPMPGALTSARTGLTDLRTTLSTVRSVSDSLRPTANELTTTLDELEPTLRTARPVVRDARVLVKDARPTVKGLVPAVNDANQIVGDVRGPVLTRLNGPVKNFLYQPYKGEGVYSMTSSKKPTYEEIVYTFVNLDRAAGLADRNGHAVSFHPGPGPGTVGGLPLSLEQLYSGMASWLYPETPVETVPPLSRPGSGKNQDGGLPGLPGLELPGGKP